MTFERSYLTVVKVFSIPLDRVVVGLCGNVYNLASLDLNAFLNESRRTLRESATVAVLITGTTQLVSYACLNTR